MTTEQRPSQEHAWEGTSVTNDTCRHCGNPWLHPLHVEQRPSKELAYRDALARIRHICRRNPKDFVAAATAAGEAYDIANRTLDTNGDLFVTAHEPPAALEVQNAIAYLRTIELACDARDDRQSVTYIGEIRALLHRLSRASQPPSDALREAVQILENGKELGSVFHLRGAIIQALMKLHEQHPDAWPSPTKPDCICDDETPCPHLSKCNAGEPSVEPAAYRLDYTAGKVEAFHLTTPGLLQFDIQGLREDGRENIRATPLYRHTEPPRARPLNASERLHNICDALSEQADESPFTREEWERVDKQTVALQKSLREAINLAEIGDITEETEAHGWGAWLKEARSVLGTSPTKEPPRYACTVPGCPGEHVSKWDRCTATETSGCAS